MVAGEGRWVLVSDPESQRQHDVDNVAEALVSGPHNSSRRQSGGILLHDSDIDVRYTGVTHSNKEMKSEIR